MGNLPDFYNLLGFSSNYVLSEYIGSYRLIDFLARPKFQIPRLKGGGRTLMTLIFMIMDDLFLRRIVEIWFDMQDACMGKRSRMMRLTRGKCQFKSKTPKRLLLPLNLKVLPIQGVLFPSHPKQAKGFQKKWFPTFSISLCRLIFPPQGISKEADWDYPLPGVM